LKSWRSAPFFLNEICGILETRATMDHAVFHG
jgi:hypothetical protein